MIASSHATETEGGRPVKNAAHMLRILGLVAYLFLEDLAIIA
jgi:hypothetical protein